MNKLILFIFIWTLIWTFCPVNAQTFKGEVTSDYYIPNHPDFPLYPGIYLSQFEIWAKTEDYYNGNLVIRVRGAVEANEIHFFKEELKYFLKKGGYRVKNIRVIY